MDANTRFYFMKMLIALEVLSTLADAEAVRDPSGPWVVRSKGVDALMNDAFEHLHGLLSKSAA